MHFKLRKCVREPSEAPDAHLEAEILPLNKTC
jgi:hypothetical protein